MYIVVQHRFREPRTAWASAQQGLANLPAGLTLHHPFPTKDGSLVVCVWEAGSVAQVREFIERALGRVSQNEYFEVENKQGVALPSSLISATR